MRTFNKNKLNQSVNVHKWLIKLISFPHNLSKNLPAQGLPKQNRGCNNAKSFLITAAIAEEDK